MKLIVATWGGLQVSLTDEDGVIELRDTIEGAVAANQLVGVIRTAMAWGRKHGFKSKDPTRDIEKLDPGEVDGATPWPEWAYKIVLNEAPAGLKRAACLGRATGQRRSDLVRLGRRSRRDDGLEFEVKKLRNKVHFIPLLKAELAEIDGWVSSDLGPYIVGKAGDRITGDTLGEWLKEFCREHPKLKDAEVFMHGLPALAVCDRRIDGMSHQEISAQLRMSMNMVMRYSKKIDTEVLARAANARRERK
jgi:integrase